MYFYLLLKNIDKKVSWWLGFSYRDVTFAFLQWSDNWHDLSKVTEWPHNDIKQPPQHAWMCFILWYWTAYTELDSLAPYLSPSTLSLLQTFLGGLRAELASEGWERGSLKCACTFNVPHHYDTKLFQQQPNIFPDLCGIASVPVATCLIAF